MMVEEEQISFCSDSLMADLVEDYSHQMAEMIGLQNESNFNEDEVILLTIEAHLKHRCSMLDILMEVDRILRPEGWVMISDMEPLVESARSIMAQLKWDDARLIDLDSSSNEKLLVCQKPFFRTAS